MAGANQTVMLAILAPIPAGGTVTLSAQLADQNENPVTTAGQLVSWASTNGGSFASTPTTTNASGIASVVFTVSTVAGVTHAITATTGALQGHTTLPVTIPGPAATLAFTQQPAGTTAGATLAAVSVTVRDRFNNVLTTAAAPISLTIAGGTGASGAMLVGGGPVVPVNGVATFTGLSIDLAGSAYRLAATSAGVPSATSGAFDVAAAPPEP
jgi:hypothetical protein